MTRALLDLFRARRIAHRHGGGERWSSGESLWAGAESELEPYSHLLSGHVLPAKLGAFSYSYSQLLRNTAVGRYCSIGAGVQFIQSEHPVNWVPGRGPLRLKPAAAPAR